MHLSFPKSRLAPVLIVFRLVGVGLVALALGCGRKHELPGAFPLLDCEVAPVSLEFGTVAMGVSADRTFTVTNTGSDTLSGTVSESCAEFELVGGSGYQLAPGSQATFTLRFQPAGAGRRSCTVAIGPLCASLPAGGDGQDPAATCSVSPSTLDFGTVNVGQSANREFSITNTGGSTLSNTVTESCPEFSIVGSASYNLAAGEADTFTVRFSPTSGGAKNCTIHTGPAACSDVSASGTGQAPNPPVCEVSTATLSFGTVKVGESADLTFSITNTGGSTLSNTVTESCPEFSIVGSASYNLAAGEADTFTVRFSPTSGGAKNCTIDTGSAACADVSASGTGQAPNPPVCEVSTATLSFGTVNVGQSADRTFTITNNGGGQLSGTVTESCAEFSIVGPAAYSLGADEEATFTVRFAPTSGGAKNCTVDTGPASCADVDASGTGQAPNPPVCQVSPATLSFGSVPLTQTADTTFTITNTGGGKLSGTVSESCPEFAIQGSGSYDLDGSESKTFTVRFAPLTPGPKNCTIDSGGDCADVSVSGTGEEPAANCYLSTTMHQFGTVPVGSTAEGELIVTNLGGGTLSGTLSESCDGFAILGNPSYNLGPLQSTTFTIEFAPTSTGDYQCALDAGSACGTVTLRGTGGAP